MHLCVCAGHSCHTQQGNATALPCFGTREVWQEGQQNRETQQQAHGHFEMLLSFSHCWFLSLSTTCSLKKQCFQPSTFSQLRELSPPRQVRGRTVHPRRHRSHHDFCDLWSLCLLQPVSRASEQTSRACPYPHVPLFSRNSTEQRTGRLQSVLRFI